MNYKNKGLMNRLAHHRDDFTEQEYDTIIKALRIAEKLMQEPTKEQGWSAYYDTENTIESMGADYPDGADQCVSIFTVMRHEMLKEIEG